MAHVTLDIDDAYPIESFAKGAIEFHPTLNILINHAGLMRSENLKAPNVQDERTVERELVPMAKDQRLTVLAWSPLRKGLLTGQYLPENTEAAKWMAHACTAR